MNNDNTRTTSLQDVIVARIRREGPLSFADYMRMALYEPEYGYYVTGQAKMGWEGDYYTSADVADFFAHCMGRQLQRLWEKQGKPAPFRVLEQGAGRGNLAFGVCEWVEASSPEFHIALDYQTDDIRMGTDAVENTAESGAFHVILSNELVDAFPVHIVEARGQHLYELYVDEQGGHLYPVLDEPMSEEVSGYLDAFNVPWRTYPDGWRAEINLDAVRWLRNVSHLLKRNGYLLTIDYGEKARNVYTPHRRYGTLTCYYHHQSNEQPLARPGQQDITAHVNFSALIAEGRRQGLRLNSYTTQRQWLEDMGLSAELEQLRAAEFTAMDTDRASNQGQIARLRWMNLQQRVAALTDPYGMGNFKVLLMRRNA